MFFIKVLYINMETKMKLIYEKLLSLCVMLGAVVILGIFLKPEMRTVLIAAAVFLLVAFAVIFKLYKSSNE